MNILFEVPQRYIAGVASNEIQRFGGVLKDRVTGKIVAHLQETGSTQKIIANLSKSTLNPFSLPLAMVEAASGVIANAQLHRIDAKIEQTLQLLDGLKSMQVANLALAGMGLGVMVTMFVYTKKRMDNIDLRLDGIDASLRQLIDAPRRIELERLETDLDAQLDLAEEAWMHGDGGQRAWTRVADSLNDMVYKYPKHIEKELESPVIADEGLLLYLLERYRILAATRIECLMLIGEKQAAYLFSQKYAERTESLLRAVTPVKFVPREQLSALQLQARLTKGRMIAAGLRDFQDVSFTRSALISDFIENKVDGREYVEQLRLENNRQLALVSF